MKRKFLIGVFVIVVLLVIVWAMVRFSKPRETQFGAIVQATMAESGSPPSFLGQASDLFSGKHWSWRLYPYVGTAQLEWSIQSTSRKAGWIYFHNPPSMSTPIWEFAPCSKTSLYDLAVEDFQTDFIQQGDPNIEPLFQLDGRLRTGKPLNGQSIPVKEGQIILARLIKVPGTLYAIKFVNQQYSGKSASTGIEYVEIVSPKKQPANLANVNDPLEAN